MLDLETFFNLYKQCTAKPYSFLVSNATLASYSTLLLRKKKLFIQKLIMKSDDKISNEKLKYGINTEVAKISALSSRKTDKYKYLTREEILPPNQSRTIEQAKFSYSHSGKVLQKQTKTIESQVQKQIKAIEEHG